MIPQATSYHELQNIVESVEMVSPTECLLNSRGKYLTSDGHMQSIRISAAGSNICPFADLHNILYTLLHCRQDLSLYYRTVNIDQYNDIQHLTEMLSAANSGHGTWDPGWEITKMERDGQQFAVQKNGLTLWASPREIFVQEGKHEVGKKCYIKIGKEFRELLPGFYMAIGNATNDDYRENSNVVRIYWNVAAVGAVPLMKNLTTELNAVNLPFRFKVLKNPHCFSRVDAAILYIDKQYLGNSKGSLSKIYKLIRIYLYHPTSIFAKKLAPGLSLAESPRTNESFGEHRCRILAEAIYNTCKKEIRSIDAKVSEVIKYFTNLGIDLNYPYLNPNCIDDYDVLLGGAFD